MGSHYEKRLPVVIRPAIKTLLNTSDSHPSDVVAFLVKAILSGYLIFLTDSDLKSTINQGIKGRDGLNL
ncbi:hypothetical protein NIES2135_55850 [Leptolyngbya boryana NIES-2135]|uniref:Uncharacterized protein n=1 Tax=Leptolyngbya boryana NIES-2135 TaxID=1973484 RepID=A0A1Z4JPR1_LEPBY|nr:hypothetical protein LBWT_10520 [Leptolyngbya boryana IAM M-101]BAS61494.1 hypothetical protein LBDG_10520 [Leptolyngbya boryana dg5]BAY58712.1 hypothetical protein NIES2135_55850 [Leptolyngbya boryana NIES-2135]